jgi:hypothetical protein
MIGIIEGSLARETEALVPEVLETEVGSKTRSPKLFLVLY